jgi:hypothetical protein
MVIALTDAFEKALLYKFSSPRQANLEFISLVVIHMPDRGDE